MDQRKFQSFENNSTAMFTHYSIFHIPELSLWIDRKSTIYSLANIPYEFQLILRVNRDGFHPKTFWNMCNGHAGTIVVAKVAGNDEIVGGYNPLSWDNSTIECIQKIVSFFIEKWKY
ncbi:hypothetical protein Glove_87g226 [Diversispora epigaea]|uniref:TLDc domain-containing protein n=1 Tax=Diversispora epigaea TaxID=1348612 RepID=A0A397JGW0_9GLOM|nr:hypothetical protein Glove_87g226 [Diversispora epigaea]